MRLSLVVVALATLLPSLSWGQVEDPDRENARRHYARGIEFYDNKDYQRAVGEFEVARRLKSSPQLDYNIARCYDRLERLSEAVTEYEHYLQRAPGSSDAGEVRERVRVLRERIGSPPRTAPATAAPATPAPATAAPTTRAAAPRPSRARRYAVPIAVGAAALALAITGSALVASVAPEYDRLKNDCARPCMDPAENALKTRATTGYALWGLAGAAAVADVVLWVVIARKRPVERAFVAPSFGGVVAGGRF